MGASVALGTSTLFLTRGSSAEGTEPEPSAAEPDGTNTPSSVHDLSMQSGGLGREVPYNPYLPAGIQPIEPTRPASYIPVVYLLHGAKGTHTAWIGQGPLKQTLDEAVAAQQIPPLAVVMPNSLRDPAIPAPPQDETFYMNDYGRDGTVRYNDMFVQEFMPLVEKGHSVGGQQGRRAIAFHRRIRRTDLHAAQPRSLLPGRRPQHGTPVHIGLRADGHDHVQPVLRPRLGQGPVVLRTADGTFWYYNLIEILKNTPASRIRLSSYYLDCGRQDSAYYAGSQELYTTLHDQGRRCRVRVGRRRSHLVLLEQPCGTHADLPGQEAPMIFTSGDGARTRSWAPSRPPALHLMWLINATA